MKGKNMMQQRQSGQTEAQVVGCVVWGILSIGFSIALIVVGGSWRTDVSFPLGEGVHSGTEISFEETFTSRHWVFGLVQGKQPDLQQVLGKFIKPDERITEVTILMRHTFVNLLLSGVTAGIYTPMMITVRGKVGKARRD